MTTVGYFLADAGARYILQDSEGVLVAKAERTGTTYGRNDVPTLTKVQITGKRRWQITCAGYGNGQRAVLHLDTGEGISVIPGVLR